MSALAIFGMNRDRNSIRLLPDGRPSCQEMQFDWQEASFEFPIAADSSLFVIPAPWFVYTTYVRL
jgi:hypothetical protein